MTSSHSQDGPSRHHSSPQPQSQPQSQLQPQPQSQPQPQPQPQAQSQSQSQSQSADDQPTPSKPPPASDRPSDEAPIPASRVADTTTTTNQEPAPSTSLPPSTDTPAYPAQTFAPSGDGFPPHRYSDNDHMNNSTSLVHNWLNNTDQLPPQPIQARPAEHVAPSEASAAAATAALATATATAVDSHAQSGFPSDFASPDVAMLGQGIPQDFVQDFPAGLPVTADSYLPIPSDNLPLSWPLPGPFSFSTPYFPPGVSNSQGNDEGMSDDDAASLDEAVLDGTRFERMARLEFADTFVAITTNTTIIGRDQRVYKRAVLDKKRAEGGIDPISTAVPQKRGHYSKSYVSQEGGALGPESDGEGRSRSSKRRRVTVDNGQYTILPKEETPAAEDPSAPDKVISSRQYVDHTPGAVPVDMENLRPSSDDVARIDIHGAGPDIIETSKGISRDHLKIQYDEENRVWQATAIGRNGFFCEERLYHKDEVVTLRSGSHLQIQAVGFIFTISGVEDGKLGNEEPRAYYEDGKKMSLDFSGSRAEEDMRDTDDAESPPAQISTPTARLETDDSDDSDGEAHGSASPKPAVKNVARKAESDEVIRPTIESDPAKEPTQSVEPDASQPVMPPKKRGPGRPPKNGVMSKREERELKKKREEEDKKNNPPQEPGEPPVKRKVGRPRKHPRPEDEGDQPEKRKYKPRKPKNEDGEDEEDPEGDKADKQKRLQKPKTPPLDLGKKEDYSEEQLQKPNKNYQMLIDEVLTSAPEGLTLKQIYKRIAKLYPYFYFCVDTKGWESSVRHNLIGSTCFQKNQETHLWKRVLGIPLESGKKRKPSDTAAEPRLPPIYNGNFHPPHGYQQPPHPQQYPNQHLVPTGAPAPMNGMPRYQPSGQAPPGLIPNSTHPGTAPSQQPGTRQGFPQQIPQQPQQPQQPNQQHQHQHQQHPQAPTTVPQASTYATTAGPPRPQYPNTQQHSYNPALNQRPQQAPLAHGTAAGSQQTQNHAQHSLTGRPGQGVPPASQRVPATVHAGPIQQNQRAPSSSHPSQPMSTTGPAAALGPAVEPSLKEFLGKFSSEVVKQLQGRVRRPHAVAVSVINRGLGLTDMSLAPEHENFEKAIINIFHTHKSTYSKPRATTISTAATEHSRPASATAAPTVNGNSTAAATVSAPAAPPSVHATSISGPNGSAPNGSATSGSSPNGAAPNGAATNDSGTTASRVNGSLTATASAANGTPVGTHPGLDHNQSTNPGLAPTGPTATSSTAAEPAPTSTAASVGNPSGSSNGVQPNGVLRVNSPVASRSSATPAPGTPTPDANDVQLLDPKLVEVIQQYKRLSQQVLIPQLGQLQAEILVMSAVNRVLGFTNDSIVPHNAQNAKLGLKEAEDALINSLKPRIDTYLRNKQAPSTVASATNARSTPTPVHAPSTTPLSLSAPSRLS